MLLSEYVIWEYLKCSDIYVLTWASKIFLYKFYFGSVTDEPDDNLRQLIYSHSTQVSSSLASTYDNALLPNSLCFCGHAEDSVNNLWNIYCMMPIYRILFSVMESTFTKYIAMVL